MAQEIELKLALPLEKQNRLRDHPLLTRFSRQPPLTRTLANQYFDTPDESLDRHAVALRIRRQGDRHIQTLKTRGESSGGLHRRNEWEWDVPGPHLEIRLLPEGALPASVALDTLAPVFSTDFERTSWQLDYPFKAPFQDPFQGSGCHIELVLDIGEARAGSLSDPICEIELELKSGPPAALFALALELARDLPLRVTRISKAERGHRLHQPERARRLPPPPMDPGQPSPWLERAQGAMEAYLFLGEPELLEALDQTLAELDRALPRTGLAPHRAELEAIRALSAGERQRRAAEQWLDDPGLGRCLLEISQALAMGRRDGK